MQLTHMSKKMLSKLCSRGNSEQMTIWAPFQGRRIQAGPAAAAAARHGPRNVFRVTKDKHVDQGKKTDLFQAGGVGQVLQQPLWQLHGQHRPFPELLPVQRVQLREYVQDTCFHVCGKC